MKNTSATLIVLCILTFAPRVSSQTQHAQAVPMALTWDYDAQAKAIVVHAVNNSGKDITGYTIAVRYRLPDGTVDKLSRSETTSDMLFALVTIQMAKDQAAEERAHRERGDGLFEAGTTRDMPPVKRQWPDVEVTADVVFYADGRVPTLNIARGHLARPGHKRLLLRVPFALR